MDVVISCGSRLHSDKLAAQCERHKVLMALITSFPKYALDSAVPREKVQSLVVHQIAAQLVRRLHSSIAIGETIKRRFDNAVARLLRDIRADIFVGWSGYSLRSFKTAKSLGMTCVIERGSTHINTHRRLLQEEYERMGEPFDSQSWERVAERELEEFELADAIFVPSRFVLNSFVENNVPESKLKCVPYGVDMRTFHPTNRERTSGTFRILSVGMITLRKGQQYLLDAVNNLMKKNKAARIELYLIGPILPDARKIVSKYRDIITFVGRKTHAEVAVLLSSASVMVLPSIEEGFARVILESMASGIPTIITPNTGGTDIISDGTNGLVVPIRDSNAILEKLELLLDNRELGAQIGRSAAASVSQGFTWDHYGDETIKGYRALMEQLN